MQRRKRGRSAREDNKQSQGANYEKTDPSRLPLGHKLGPNEARAGKERAEDGTREDVEETKERATRQEGRVHCPCPQSQVVPASLRRSNSAIANTYSVHIRKNLTVTSSTEAAEAAEAAEAGETSELLPAVVSKLPVPDKPRAGCSVLRRCYWRKDRKHSPSPTERGSQKKAKRQKAVSERPRLDTISGNILVACQAYLPGFWGFAQQPIVASLQNSKHPKASWLPSCPSVFLPLFLTCSFRCSKTREQKHCKCRASFLCSPYWGRIGSVLGPIVTCSWQVKAPVAATIR